MVNDKARRSVIQFEDVSFEYPGAETDSIHHISLDVKEGEFLVLTGGSGCGKTTLTRLVNGLGEQFYEGTLKGRITLLGRNISEYPLYEIGKKVGSIFQDPKSQFFASITEAVSYTHLDVYKRQVQLRPMGEACTLLCFDVVLDINEQADLSVPL